MDSIINLRHLFFRTEQFGRLEQRGASRFRPTEGFLPWNNVLLPIIRLGTGGEILRTNRRL